MKKIQFVVIKRGCALLTSLLLFAALGTTAQTITSAGNWSNTAIWQGGNIGDLITENPIFNNNIGTVALDASYTVGNIDMGNSNTMTINSSVTLNMGQSGTPKGLTVGNTGVINVNGTLISWGDLIVNNILDLNVAPGATLIIKGNVTMGNGADLTISGNVQIDGNFTGGTNTNFAVSGTVAIGGNLSVQNNSTATGTGTVTVGGTCTDGTSVFCAQGPLPVTLLFFKTEKIHVGVSLSWATASEKNFDFFDLEKSSDGKNFYTIATIKGNGTTNERHDYSFEDEKSLIGKNYYRLKSVDFDGYTEIFNVVMVDFDGSKSFSVWPNPSNGVSFTAETNFTPTNRAFVSVYNTMGSEIAHFEVTGNLSTLNMPIKLESGVYYAKYISSDFTSTSRLLVK